jgi:glutathione S-transferase
MNKIRIISSVFLSLALVFVISKDSFSQNNKSNKTMNQLELISHPLCPYNQRCVITLLEKGLVRDKDFKVTYVDLDNLPIWFLKISPNKSFPVLRVNGETVLLKTNPINEFLNESTPGSLHTDDLIQRATDRYWIEYASGPLDAMRDVYVAKDKESIEKSITKLFALLEPFEKQLEERPNYFRGNKFTLVDGAYAPLFKLLFQFNTIATLSNWDKLPRTKQWATHLLSLEVTQKSATPTYAQEFDHFFQVFGSYFPKWVSEGN